MDIPKCTRCQIEMIIGKAIDSGPDEYKRNVCSGMNGMSQKINSKTLALVPCWKCPNCGESRDHES